jgi:peptidoglycan/LPS O-acetylase OafA/YrhL
LSFCHTARSARTTIAIFVSNVIIAARILRRNGPRLARLCTVARAVAPKMPKREDVQLMRDGRIATIDGLRGIAILLVVWFHVWQISWQPAVIPFVNLSLQPLAETGFIGVALFFFISGFVLMLPYAQAHLADEPLPSVRHFFSRRFFKIVPSYALCIAALLAIGYQTYPNAGAAVRDVGFHLLFIQNWFGATNGTIDGVMWSLGAEVQFYLVFPFIAPLFVRRPVLITLAMIAIALTWRLWCINTNHYFIEMRLQQLPAYLDFFAAGMIGAYAYAVIAMQRPHIASRRWMFTALSALGFILIVVVANVYFDHRYNVDWPHQQDIFLRPVLAMACLAAGLGSLFAVRSFQRVLANRVLLFLAAISYNLYLWHQPIARELLKFHLPPFAGADPHDDHVWQIAFWFVAIPVALGASALITYGFERPILRWGHRRERGALVAADSSLTDPQAQAS